MTLGKYGVYNSILDTDLNCSSVVVKKDAVQEFNVYAQEFLKTTVWASGCRSW
jgi:hypothetical protein